MLAASWLTIRKRWIWKGAAKYIAAMTVIMFVIMQIGSDDHTPVRLFAEAITGAVVGLVGLAALVLYWQWCVPRAVRKTYAQLQYEGAGAHFEFDDDGIRISDHTASMNVRWSQLVRWTENDRFVLLYRTDYQSHYVPKQQVDVAMLDSLRANLTAAEVPRF